MKDDLVVSDEDKLCLGKPLRLAFIIGISFHNSRLRGRAELRS